jgi:signal transduction histidine kinase
MRLSLRTRIVLTLLPLLALIAVLGIAAVLLLHRLGNQIDVMGGRVGAILHENYDSVLYMERLNEALERIDSSFQFALANRESKARTQYAENWAAFNDRLRQEQNNITIPGEGDLVARLTALAEQYRRQGDAFYARPAGDPRRHDDYFAAGGLYDQFKEIKTVSAQILELNQENMVDASREAKETASQTRRTARQSLLWLAVGLIAVSALAIFLAWYTLHSVMAPVQAITDSAVAIGLGNLDQVAPVLSRDELGRLAEAFNTMARQLRNYRKTDYARLLRAQRTSQATIDSIPDPVLVVDSESVVEMANPAAKRLLGVAGKDPDNPATVVWQPPEALRQPLTEALHNQRAYLPEGFDQAVRLRENDQELCLLPRVLPIQDPYGGTLGAAVVLLDVTRFRLLDQVKSDLVATVSHELKTPLTSVRLALHLLLEESVGPLTAKQTELLLDARENAERLLARVNSLLDLARLEQRRDELDIQSQPPEELLRTAADTYRPLAADKGIELVLDTAPGLPAVAADARRLGHALGNLLDNAVKYTDRGGRIALSAVAAGDRVLITVSDTGRGIPPEYVHRVFDRFFRVPGQSVEGGTGLGLAIAREIVAAHGGTISCESRVGEGTTFRLTLPVAK